MKPSVGRIVHYVSYGTPGGEYSRECRAAMVTEVDHVEVKDEGYEHLTSIVQTVGLCVLNPTGQFFNRQVPLHSGNEGGSGGTNMCGGLDYRGGTWHWITEREPQSDTPQVHVTADLSPQQVKRVTEMIQASLLQQAKRSRRPGFA